MRIISRNKSTGRRSLDMCILEEDLDCLPQVESSTRTGNPHLDKVLSELKRYREQQERGESSVEDDYAEAWNSLGLIRIHMQNNATEAKKCHEQALRIYRTKKTAAVNIATTLIDRGLCYERLAQQDEALTNYQQALQLLKDQSIAEGNILVRTTQRSISRLCRR